MTTSALERPVRLPSWWHVGLQRGLVETRIFFRRREAVVFTVVLPVLLLSIFGAVFDDEIAPGVSFAQYFAAGMIASGLVSAGFQALAISLAYERDSYGLKRLHGTPMPAGSYFLGKAVVVVISTILQVALLIGIGAAAFGLELPTAEGWVTFAWLCLLGVTCSTLLGIAFSSLARDGDSAPALVTPVVLVLQFISGVFFLYSELPTWMQQVAAIFPLKWMTQGMRSVFLPESFASQEVAGSWELPKVALVLVIWCVIGLVLCLRTFRWQRRGED